jgi:hypothetical protein
MSVPEKVVAFLHGGAPGTYCDDCIKHELGLPRRQEVAIITLTLGLCKGFHRELGSCASRNHVGTREKLVTRVA